MPTLHIDALVGGGNPRHLTMVLVVLKNELGAVVGLSRNMVSRPKWPHETSETQ